MKKIILMFMFILLVGNLAAFKIGIDDFKNYDEEEKTYTLTNFFGLGKNIATLELKTPENFVVGAGYQKVAEIEIVNGEYDYEGIINAIELYDLNEGFEPFIRQVDYKYKKLVKVPTYTSSCGMQTSINGTKSNICTQVQNGNRLEEKWVDFTNNSLNIGENITLGLFTEVKVGDKVEWVVNVYGNERLKKWAIWTQDLNVGLVGFYAFNQTSGAVVDSTGNKVATNNGATRGQAGIINFSFEFDGTNDVVETDANFGISGTQERTACGWIDPDTTNTNEGLLEFGVPSVNNRWTWTFLTGAMRVEIDAGGVTSNIKPLLGQFSFVCLRLNGTTLGDHTFYLINSSGNFTDSPASALAIDTTDTPLRLGNGSNDFFDGNMDEFGIWNRSLTLDEIVQIWNNGTGLTFTNIFPPIVNVTFPENITYIIPQTELNYTVVVGVSSIDRCWFSTDGGITNSSDNDCSANFTTTSVLGGNTWTVFSNDTSGNVGQDSVTFTLAKFLENQSTFNAFTFETKTEEFIINVTTNGTADPSSSSLIYDETNKGSSTITNTGGNNFNISQTIDIPTGSGNKTWFFNVTTGGIKESSSSNSQRVASINLTVCQLPPQNVPYINLTFTNETVNQEDITASISSSVWQYFLGTGVVNKTLNFANTTEAFNYTFCFSPSNQTLSTTLDVAYTNTQSQQRIFSSTFATLTNVTTQQQLFLLPTILGLFSQFSTEDVIGNRITDVLATITRVLGGVTITVTSDTTDGSGVVVFFLNPDVTYTGIFSKTGFVTNTFTFIPVTGLRTVVLGSTEAITVNGTTIGLGTEFEIQPNNDSLNNNTITTFSFNVTGGTGITLISMNITNSTNQLSFVSNAGVGFISDNINTGDNTQIFGEFIIQTANETITVQRIWTIGPTFIGDYSLFRQLTLFNEYGFKDIFRFLIVLGIMVALLIFLSGENQLEDETKMLVMLLLVWAFSIVGWLDTGIAVSSTSTKINDLTQFSSQFGIAILTTVAASYFILRRVLRII